MADDNKADRPRTPSAIPTSTIDFPDLGVSIELDEQTVIAGANLHGVARLDNLGSSRIAFVTSALLGGIFSRHNTVLAGDFVGWVAPAGIVVDLREGEHRELHLIIGTTSCGLDAVVASGLYETVIRIPVSFQSDDGPLVAHHLLVRRGPTITVRSPSD